MASKVRYRHGVVKYRSLKTNASYPIEIGDLCYAVAGVLYPASALADAGAAADNRAAFAAAFAGVAVRKTGLQTGETSFKLTTDPGYTLVATSGTFEFPCASTSWQPGDLVGVYATADACSNQQVCKVTNVAEAIGTAVVPHEALGTAQTTILVDIRSALIHESISGQ